MKKTLFFLFVLASAVAQGQTWSSDVAQIFYNKCTQCHHPGGAAPFSLMTHAEVSPLAAAVYQCVNTGEMPPWPPDSRCAYISLSFEFETFRPDLSLRCQWPS